MPDPNIEQLLKERVEQVHHLEREARKLRDEVAGLWKENAEVKQRNVLLLEANRILTERLRASPGS